MLRSARLLLAALTVLPALSARPDPPAEEKARLEEILAAEKGKYAPAPVREFNLRGGLPNAFAKLRRGEAVTVAYFGTSVTRPPGWRVMTFDWLQREFPAAKLRMVEASLGGTGSVVGAFRADRDLIAAKPDLVFIEFAGNDNPDAASRPGDVLRAIEGIVRKLRRANPLVDICLVYLPGSGDFNRLLAGQSPPGMTLHELVAAHYDLPSICASLEAARLERAGKLVVRAPKTDGGLTADGKIIFTLDGSHPTIPRGHAVWAGVVEEGLRKMRVLAAVAAPPFPRPLLDDNWEFAHTLPLAGHARLSGVWEKLTAANGPRVSVEGSLVYDAVPVILRTATPGASLTVRFRGTYLGVKGITGPDSGLVSIQVDAAPPIRQSLFTFYGKSFGYGGQPLPAMKAGEHTVTWTLLADKPDKKRILTSKNRPGNERDVRDHPEKYAENSFSAGEILVVGEILPPPSPSISSIPKT